MIQFYSPDILESHVLPEDESGHCCRVLRKKMGDEITVIDGNGKVITCKIVNPHSKHTEVEILNIVETSKNRDYLISLAIAPTKNSERIEWMVEKCVEIGIDEIIFLRCYHSERKEIKLDRLEKIAISAMKQSLKSYKPILSQYVNFNDFLNNFNPEGQKFIGYCSSTLPRLELVKSIHPHNNITILIGPEGDFSLKEVEMATQSGFIPVTFGENRLRTETAGLYAVTTVHVINSLFKV